MNLGIRLQPDRAVPAEYRSNFTHLYLDIGWWGVLSASALTFVAVYAARIGANAFQIGLLTAGPAVVNLALTLPVGRWLEKQPIGVAVFWSAVFFRLFYALWIPLPWLLRAEAQVWAIVASTLLMNIPGTSLAIGFNALFAGAVPPEWRGHVVGVRNALLAVTTIAISLLCGWILVRMSFPAGYQVVFAIGFLGAAMSTLHLWFLASAGQTGSHVDRGLGDLIWPSARRLRAGIRSVVSLRFLTNRGRSGVLRTDILRGSYGKLIGVLFTFYLALYLAIPLFALFWVNQLHLTDQAIGLGNALFYVAVLLGSTQMPRLVRRLGNQSVTAIGALLMSSYPAFNAASRGLGLFLVASVGGGLGWSLAGGASLNYLLEKIPEDQRPAHLAWYNVALNAALLIGSLIGPLIAGWIHVRVALAVFAVCRLLAALLILRWE